MTTKELTKPVPTAKLADKPDVRAFRLNAHPLFAAAEARLGALQAEKRDLEDRLHSSIRRSQEQRKHAEGRAVGMVVFDEQPAAMSAVDYEPESLSNDELMAEIAAHATAIEMQKRELAKIGDRVSKEVVPQWVADHEKRVAALAKAVRIAREAHGSLEQLYTDLEATGLSWLGPIRPQQFWPISSSDESRVADWLKEVAEYFPNA